MITRIFGAVTGGRLNLRGGAMRLDTDCISHDFTTAAPVLHS